MQFSFQPRQAFVITSDLSIPAIHQILSQKFNTQESGKTWWAQHYCDTSYMGTGDVFRIDNEVKSGRQRIKIVAIGDLSSVERKTVIKVQYDGYVPVIDFIFWPLLFISSILFIGSFALLIKSITDGAGWALLLISLLLLGVPQLNRLYFDGFISNLHNSLMAALNYSKNKL